MREIFPKKETFSYLKQEWIYIHIYHNFMQIYQSMHINRLMIKFFKNNAKIFFKNKFLWCSVLCICRNENITEVCVQQNLSNAFKPQWNYQRSALLCSQEDALMHMRVDHPLRHEQLISGHSPKGKWLSLPQEASTANSSLARSGALGTSYPFVVVFQLA